MAADLGQAGWRRPGEFTTPHAIWIDGEGRVLVADRENNRIQVFTPDGDYLASWGDHYHPMDIYGGPDGLDLRHRPDPAPQPARS